MLHSCTIQPGDKIYQQGTGLLVGTEAPNVIPSGLAITLVHIRSDMGASHNC